MRVSVNKDDPGYRDDASCFFVTVDGARADWCVTADEEAGEVHVMALDKFGRPIPVNGKMRTEVRRGVVVISRGPA